MKKVKNTFRMIYQMLPALLVLSAVSAAVMTQKAAAQNPAQTDSQSSKQTDFFGERFGEGRLLIDKGEWARAAEKFREALENNPKHWLADDSLYWLAFCYKKQKMFKESAATLERLFQRFPDSTWIGDAEVMKMEILPFVEQISEDSFNADQTPNPAREGQFYANLQAQITNDAADKSGQKPAIGDGRKIPLDRADEIRLAAFQSLLAADPRRAVETMGEVLKPDSTASEVLKQEILRVLRTPRVSKTADQYFAQSGGGIGRELLPLIRETLAKSFQNEKNIKIRREVIYSLASLPDAQTTEFLKNLYNSESDREIKKAIIGSFGSSARGLFSNAGFDVAQKQKGSIDAEQALKRKMEQDVLLEIIRAEKDAELRRMAFAALRPFQNWSANDQFIETMTRLYDAETDEEFKVSLVRAFGEAKNAQATKKLLDIARSDKSDKLRLEAIYALRTSKDPEALKFLENLIK